MTSDDALPLEEAEAARVITALSAGGSGLARLSEATPAASLARLVGAPRRAYHAFVLFNARAPQHNCASCV